MRLRHAWLCSLACVAMLADSPSTWSQQVANDSIPRIVREANQLDAEIASMVDGWDSELLVGLAFGLPTHEDRVHAEQRAVRSLDRIRIAREEMAQMLRSTEAVGGMDDPLKREALSRALLIESVSMPLMEARSQLMLALSHDDTLGRTPPADALDAFEAAVVMAGKVESASAWADVERGLIVGVALLALDENTAAQHAFDDADDALREDDSLNDAAFGLGSALRLARASSAFHRQDDTTTAIGAAQRRLRGGGDVSQAHRSALLMRLLVVRAAGQTNAQARTVLTARLDEIARSLLTEQHADDNAVMQQLARVAEVSGMDARNEQWTLGPAVGIALALDDMPIEPSRDRTEALTALLDRDREAMGGYVVVALSALADALAACVADGACSLDIALNVAHRAVESRPLHTPTRQALERLCIISLESDQPPTAITWRSLLVLTAHLPDSAQADAWRCRAIAKAFDSTPEGDAAGVMDAMELAGPFVHELEFANSSAVPTVLYICKRLAYDMIAIEREQLDATPTTQQTDLLHTLARRTVSIAEQLEGPPVEPNDLAQARALRACAQLVLGDTAHVLELTQPLVTDRPSDPLTDGIHLRALLASRQFEDAEAWFAQPRPEEATGELLIATLLHTRPLWSTGPELTQSLDDAGIGTLSEAHQQELAVVMAWAVAQNERWAMPELALRRGIGWLIAMHHPKAIPLAASFATQSATDTTIIQDRMVLAAEALLHEGDDAGAFAILRDLVTSVPPELRSTRSYWHASVRMIQVLMRQNNSGARTPTITREITRLRLQPTWGHHPDCTQAIDRIANDLGLKQVQPPVHQP